MQRISREEIVLFIGELVFVALACAMLAAAVYLIAS